MKPAIPHIAVPQRITRPATLYRESASTSRFDCALLTGARIGSHAIRLSIVIPTYRRNTLLAEIIAVLAPQLSAVPGVEVLVVDNDPEGGARKIVPGDLRYIHETRRGVVHARNRGVAEAQGGHILFLDDDEIPAPGWLAAFAAQADAGVVASFGRIVPRYEAAPDAGLKGLLDSLFSREAEGATGADITPIWAYLGTGNAMFDRARCFPNPAPFDPRFNASGGEDIWMIRGLMARGIRLTWNREALVEEVVPADRMTLAFLKSRKFAHGQQRVIFMRGAGGMAGAARMLLWMGVGVVQTAGHGARRAIGRATGAPWRHDSDARVSAGLGKLLWWRSPLNPYHD